MTCDKAREMLTAHALGDLDPAVAAEVRGHVESCEACRAALREIEPTLDLLRAALAASRPQPAHLTAERRAKVESVLAQRKPAKQAVQKRKVLQWLVLPHFELRHVASVVVVVAVLAVLCGLLLPGLSASRERACMASSMNNLRIIQAGVEQYKMDHDGKMPEKPEDIAQYIKGPAMPKSPVSGKDYLYLGKDFNGNAPADVPVAADVIGNGGLVAFSDGRIERRNKMELAQDLDRARRWGAKIEAGAGTVGKLGFGGETDGKPSAPPPPPAPPSAAATPPAEPKAGPFDSVSVERSPVVMRGLYGSRESGTRGGSVGYVVGGVVGGEDIRKDGSEEDKSGVDFYANKVRTTDEVTVPARGRPPTDAEVAKDSKFGRMRDLERERANVPATGRAGETPAATTANRPAGGPAPVVEQPPVAGTDLSLHGYGDYVSSGKKKTTVTAGVAAHEKDGEKGNVNWEMRSHSSRGPTFDAGARPKVVPGGQGEIAHEWGRGEGPITRAATARPEKHGVAGKPDVARKPFGETVPPAAGPAGGKESGKVPLLGNVPLLGRLFHERTASEARPGVTAPDPAARRAATTSVGGQRPAATGKKGEGGRKEVDEVGEELPPPKVVEYQIPDLSLPENLAPSPPVDFSCKPTHFSSVAMVKSPIVTRGGYGSRSPGARGEAGGLVQETVPPAKPGDTAVVVNGERWRLGDGEKRGVRAQTSTERISALRQVMKTKPKSAEAAEAHKELERIVEQSARGRLAEGEEARRNIAIADALQKQVKGADEGEKQKHEIADLSRAVADRDESKIEKEGQVEKAKDAKQATLDKLKNVMIPEIDFRQANINDVVMFLNEQVREHDKSADGKKGVDLVLGKTRDGNSVVADNEVPLITFSAKQIAGDEALKVVTSVVGLDYKVENGRIMVVPKDSPMGEVVVREKTEDLTGPRFKAVGVNPVVETATQPFSTFSMDVDTAAYTLARNYMLKGLLPPAEAVRTEEFVNFFDYDYKPPEKGAFRIHVEAAPTPFGRGLHLLKIGVKGRRIGRDEKRGAVLTLVIDTSGSMNTPDRLDLVKKAVGMMLERLAPNDRVAIVQFGSRARLALDYTPASEKKSILGVLGALQTSGSTNLEGAMRLAYQAAARAFTSGAANRVLVMSDGAANLGTDAAEHILAQVEACRKQGIYCSVFGFGIGTYNDEMLETLANKGDGTYAFVDSEEEAERVFVSDLSATLNTIAADAKIQVEFNPKIVRRYRQLGYENRQLKKEQFRDDTVDAGEVGSGQAVTALYEIEIGTPHGAGQAEAQRQEKGRSWRW